MIIIERADTANIIVTATEKQVVSPTQFTLWFRHDVTKEVVSYEDASDVSPAPQRYNKFMIDLAPFADQDNGFYTYEVRDQLGNVLEVGKMKLEGEKVTPTQYEETPTQYITYGQ